MGMIFCYEEILKEMNRSLSSQTSVRALFKSLSAPSILLDTASDDPDDQPGVKKEMPPYCWTLQAMVQTTHLDLKRKCLRTVGHCRR